MKDKRPASHRWAIGLYGFMTAGFVIFLINAMAGRSGAGLAQNWYPVLVLSVGVVALVALVLAGREKWGYYVASASLAVWTIRAVYTSCWYVHHLLFSGTPTVTPYFNLVEGHKPFVVPQQMSPARQVLIFALTGLLVWLFIRFTFGRPSRNYYGFGETGGKPSRGPEVSLGASSQQSAEPPESTHI